MRAHIAIALLLVGASGCKRGPGVDITIDASNPALTSATLQSIASLSISVSGAETAHATRTPSSSLASKRQERIVYTPGVTTGRLTITVSATDRSGALRAMGSAAVSVAAGAAVTVPLAPASGPAMGDMAIGGGGDMPAAPDMASNTPVITPSAPTVTRKKTQPFSADRAVTWSVMEANGGAIDQTGVYTAPDAPGVYHVLATADGVTGTATVIVSDYAITLFTGQIGGSGNIDGAALQARFSTGQNIWSNSGGVYISDFLTVRSYDSVAQTLTTIAGSPTSFGHMDGVGSAATFGSFLNGITMDSAGFLLWVCDQQNNLIRSVSLDRNDYGHVITQLGQLQQNYTEGTGTGAQFCYPYGLTDDGAGNLYLADQCNYVIRKIVKSTLVTSLVAGTPKMAGTDDGALLMAKFKGPTDVVAASTSVLYVADMQGQTIRKVDIANNMVSTLAGQPLTTGSADGNGTTARFNYPQTLTRDTAGNLYIADIRNYTIRKVTTAGDVTTIAGRAGVAGDDDGPALSATFNYPRGVSWTGTPGNYVYVMDTDSAALRRIDLTAGTVTTVAGVKSGSGSSDGTSSVARFNRIDGITADGAGNYYVSDNGNNTIRKVDVNGAVTTLAGTAGVVGAADDTGSKASFNSPIGLTYYKGALYVVDNGNNSIRRVDVATGAVTTFAGMSGVSGPDNGTGASARFNGPTDIVGDGNGTLYVTDTSNATIRAIDVASRNVTTLIGTAGTSGDTDSNPGPPLLTAPSGITYDAGSGSLVFSEPYSSLIRQVVIAGPTLTTIAGTKLARGSMDGTGAAATFRYPGSVTSDGKGTIYISDAQNSLVRQLVLSTKAVTTLAGTAQQEGVLLNNGLPARLNLIGAVFYDSAGDIVVSAENSLLIVRIP